MSIGLNTLSSRWPLAPVVGYDAAATIAKAAYEKNISLKEAAIASGLVSAEQFDAHVKPEAMVKP